MEDIEKMMAVLGTLVVSSWLVNIVINPLATVVLTFMVYGGFELYRQTVLNDR